MLPIILNLNKFKVVVKNSFAIFVKVSNFLIILLTVFLHFLAKWLKKSFNDMPFNDILFNIFMPIKGTEKNLIDQFIAVCVLPSLFFSILIFFVVNRVLIRIHKKNNMVLNYKIFRKNSAFNIIIDRASVIFKIKMFCGKFKVKVSRHFICFLLVCCEVCCVYSSLNTGFKSLKIDAFLKENKQNSSFIKNNYKNPKNTELIFPLKKRNLIYIFAESMESSYFSKDLGGNEEENLLAPLTELAVENLNFSNNDRFGGAYSTFGSKFTTAGLVSQTLGIPLKISPKIVNLVQNHAFFFNNAYGLGNILQKAGYRQMFMIGSDKKFGNRDVLMENHGNYEIYDYYSAIEEKKIEPNHKVWWGLEDSLLFEIAKEKLSELSKQNAPFNFTMLTTNTHCPEGFLEQGCEPRFVDNYSNAVYYSAEQINDFVRWVQQQPFYENTTIVIAGDHLSMAKKHFSKYNNDKRCGFDRTIFNLFINCEVKPFKCKNRVFNSLDLFPTTLASLGVKIKGDRLALGTNLFSDRKTVSEIYGIEFVDRELKKRSNFYDINFIYLH